MKKILTIVLILVAISGWSQVKKLNHYYVLRPSDTDTLQHYRYTYDNNSNLIRIDRKFYDMVWSTHYQHDTLVMESYIHVEGDTSFIMFSYYNDSIVTHSTYLGYTVRGVYLLDDLDHILSYQDIYTTESYAWDGENCIEMIRNGVILTATYQSWINPFYEESKYFRKGTSGSHDFSEYTYTYGDVFQNIVIESEGDYPVYVDYYENDELHFKLYFDYLETIDINETTPGADRIIDVDYFDLMGRKIPKPEQGFYIERKTTDKGIIATKYFKG